MRNIHRSHPIGVTLVGIFLGLFFLALSGCGKQGDQGSKDSAGKDSAGKDSAGKDAKPDELARSAAESFLKAVKDKDKDALAKLLGVPWVHDMKRVVKEREWLDDRLPTMMNDFGTKTLKVKEVVEYSQYLDKSKDVLKDKERGLLDEVMKKGDYIVILQANNNDVPMMIQVRDGKAMIVGMSY